MLTGIDRTFEGLALAALLALGLTCTAIAQQSTTPPPTTTPPATGAPDNINRTELDNFDHFLDNHPKVAQELRQNPSLINDPTFQAQHPQLQTFLKNHPGVSQQVQANPTRFMNRERQFEARGGDITRAEAASADQFLDSHPKAAEELRKNPGLIDNKEWVAKHPQLEEYLKNHPEVRKDWQAHPKAFERRQAQYQKHEHQPKPVTHQ